MSTRSFSRFSASAGLLAALCLTALIGCQGAVPGAAWSAPQASASAPISASSSAAPVAADPSADPSPFLDTTVRDAPPIALMDANRQPVTLSALRGNQVLVFFGFTHCTDVCPATVGMLGVAMSNFGQGVQTVFVTIDPERDTPAWLTEYDRYLPSGITTATGSAEQIRTTASAWGVQYAREATDDSGGYEMSHTADVFLVDANGRLRADFPYGTDAAAVAAVLREVAATTPVQSSGALPTSPAVTNAPSALVLQAEVVSSSIWAGANSPVILGLTGPGGRLNDMTATVTVQLTTPDGTPVGASVAAMPVRPPGLDDVSWVASLDIPTPRAYRFAVTAQSGVLPMTGSTGLVTALDQGATPAIGSAAPTVHTPTLDDAGGDARVVSTDPIPDQRLYRQSTTDALAANTPFVLVMDSTRFRVTTACGKALVMARYLLDRWPDVTFIHHEPFVYSIVTDTPVLEGTLSDPVLTPAATAWGLGSDPWSATSMPWIFIVDGNGTVRAKYQGVIGTEDVDVIVSLIAQGG
jgi:protein SCO1